MKPETKFLLGLSIGMMFLTAPFVAMRLEYIPLIGAANMADVNNTLYPGIAATILSAFATFKSFFTKDRY